MESNYQKNIPGVNSDISFDEYFTLVELDLTHQGYKGHIEKESFRADYNNDVPAGYAASDYLATLSD